MACRYGLFGRFLGVLPTVAGIVVRIFFLVLAQWRFCSLSYPASATMCLTETPGGSLFMTVWKCMQSRPGPLVGWTARIICMVTSASTVIFGHRVKCVHLRYFASLERILWKYGLMCPDCRPAASRALSFTVLLLPITSLTIFSINLLAQSDFSNRLEAFCKVLRTSQTIS